MMNIFLGSRDRSQLSHMLCHVRNIVVLNLLKLVKGQTKFEIKSNIINGELI